MMKAVVLFAALFLAVAWAGPPITSDLTGLGGQQKAIDGPFQGLTKVKDTKLGTGPLIEKGQKVTMRYHRTA